MQRMIKLFSFTIETVGRPMVPVRVTATGWMMDWLVAGDWPDSITADSSSSGGGAGVSIPAISQFRHGNDSIFLEN